MDLDTNFVFLCICSSWLIVSTLLFCLIPSYRSRKLPRYTIFLLIIAGCIYVNAFIYDLSFNSNSMNTSEYHWTHSAFFLLSFNATYSSSNTSTNNLYQTESTMDSIPLHIATRFVPKFTNQSDKLKLPQTDSILYTSESDYFKSFIHYHDDWRNITQTNWSFPDDLQYKYYGMKKKYSEWHYHIIDYPIYPNFLQSNKPRQQEMITIVTQCSIERLAFIRMVSDNWDGIISLAIYIRLEESLTESEQIIYQFWRDIELNTRCILDIHLLFEFEHASKYTDDSYFSVMYPVNHLRNLALQCAKSEYVLLSDADFLPSHNFHDLAIESYHESQRLLKLYKFAQLKKQINNMTSVNDKEKEALINNIDKDAIFNENTSNHLALIIPAFELNLDRKNEYEVVVNSTKSLPLTKEKVSAAYLNDTVRGFHMHRCYKCHKPTNYEKWVKEVTKKPYRIGYKSHYEPYILTKRVGLHRYDARFRGYGFNKIFHLKALHKLDSYYWVVAPNAFLFHVPHQESRDRAEFSKKGYGRRWLGGLYKLALRESKKQQDAAGYITA